MVSINKYAMVTSYLKMIYVNENCCSNTKEPFFLGISDIVDSEEVYGYIP